MPRGDSHPVFQEPDDRLLAPFRAVGGEFRTSPGDLRARLAGVKGFLFDWDGVFNEGIKGTGTPSGFSESDAMGTNLLRFGWWLRDGRLPFVGVLTGQDNPAAVALAERERFHVVYRGFLDKLHALRDLESRFGIRPEQVCFLFDDVLDLGVADACGLRVLIRNGATPLLRSWAEREQRFDYTTGREGGRHAVRESAELLLGLAGRYDEAVRERSVHSARYRKYLGLRNETGPVVLSPADI
ncbi:MAG: phosphatase [marine benthic group bacterium]|nr:phosphatase [Gemmatimonadota bacterium]